eukprot:32849_1
MASKEITKKKISDDSPPEDSKSPNDDITHQSQQRTQLSNPYLDSSISDKFISLKDSAKFLKKHNEMPTKPKIGNAFDLYKQKMNKLPNNAMEFLQFCQQHSLKFTYTECVQYIQHKQQSEKITTVGDRVKLKKNNLIGVVRFVGEIKGKKGIFYGVELDDNKGKNDGSVENVPYFKCSKKKGLFVSRSGIINTYAGNTKNVPRVTVGDRVKCLKAKCNGKIRYIGTPYSVKQSGILYGVELEKPNGKNNGTVKGRWYFTCRYKCGVFLQPAGFSVLNEQKEGVEYKVGDRVMIKPNKKGQIKWIGTCKAFGIGTYYGIRLVEKRGNNDGRWKGVRFFQCPQGFGVYVQKRLIVKSTDGNFDFTNEEAKYQQENQVEQELYRNQKQQLRQSRKLCLAELRKKYDLKEKYGKSIKAMQQKLINSYFSKVEVKKRKNKDKDKRQNYGKWDGNLLDGISSIVTGSQKENLRTIIKQFEKNIDEKLKEHQAIRDTISVIIENRGDDNIDVKENDMVEQKLNSVMKNRKTKLEKQYKTDIDDVLNKFKEGEHIWKSESAKLYRQKHHEKHLDKLRVMFEKAKCKINDKLISETNKLNSSHDIEKWSDEFVEQEMQEEKINTVKQMIIKKIEETRQQIQYAKYLHNSPFADDLKKSAQQSDHEIVEIAKLAGEPLVIDMMEDDYDYGVNSEDDEQDEKKEPEPKCEYLDFELRLDISYNKEWNDLKREIIKNEFAKLLDIDPNDIEFDGDRNGCVVAGLKIKLNKLCKKFKKNTEKMKNQAKQKIEQFGKKLYAKSHKWVKDIENATKFLKKRLGEAKVNNNAFYVATKCVAI